MTTNLYCFDFDQNLIQRHSTHHQEKSVGEGAKSGGTSCMSLGKHVNYEWPPPGTVTLKGYFQWKTGVPDLEEGMGGTGHKNGE